MSQLRANHEDQLTIIMMKAVQELTMLLPCEATPDTIVLWANTLIDDFWYLTIDDVLLCLKRGRRGDYGKLFGKLEYSTIVEWMRKYDTEKQADSQDMNQHLKDQSTKQLDRASSNMIIKRK